MIKLEYNNKTVVGVIENFKDIFTQSYYKIKEFGYTLEVNTKTTIERELVVGIKTLLDIVFIT